MAKNQKKYTQEFKQQLVDLYNTGNYSFPQLSSEYGVAKSTILGWVRNLSPIQVSETETISMKEYKALQKKMKELEIENEILKQSHSHQGWHLPYSQRNDSRVRVLSS